ncbi:hypothetical protein M885DRAFT_529620 [Pelagophyceae sp. CCMP2097]|nr:hypothetical protein M885DRAFT_529620 [Pelagophyceae sp. CCMP2097]
MRFRESRSRWCLSRVRRSKSFESRGPSRVEAPRVQACLCASRTVPSGSRQAALIRRPAPSPVPQRAPIDGPSAAQRGVEMGKVYGDGIETALRRHYGKGRLECGQGGGPRGPRARLEGFSRQFREQSAEGTVPRRRLGSSEKFSRRVRRGFLNGGLEKAAGLDGRAPRCRWTPLRGPWKRPFENGGRGAFAANQAVARVENGDSSKVQSAPEAGPRGPFLGPGKRFGRRPGGALFATATRPAFSKGQSKTGPRSIFQKGPLECADERGPISTAPGSLPGVRSQGPERKPLPRSFKSRSKEFRRPPLQGPFSTVLSPRRSRGSARETAPSGGPLETAHQSKRPSKRHTNRNGPRNGTHIETALVCLWHLVNLRRFGAVPSKSVFSDGAPLECGTGLDTVLETSLHLFEGIFWTAQEKSPITFGRPHCRP